MTFLKFLDRNHYSCTDCGKCCNSGWKVAVRPSDAVKIEATDAYRSRVKAGYTPLVLSEGQHLVGKTKSGACTFLTDSGCDIHREIGSTGKPGTCQVYPFQMSLTPDGLYVSLAFSCPAVISGFGAPSEHYQDELLALFRPPAIDAVHEFFRIADVPIDWPDYLLLEQKMLEQLRPVQDDPVTTLIDLACQLIQTTEDAEQLESLHDLAFNLLPLFAASCLSVMENGEILAARDGFREKVLSPEGVTSERLGCHLPMFSHCRPRDLFTRDAISRYIRQNVEGKRLLSGPTTATRMLILACGVAIVLYLTEALTNHLGQARFSFESLERAFELVEVELVTHSSDLDELFEQYELALVSAL